MTKVIRMTKPKLIGVCFLAAVCFSAIVSPQMLRAELPTIRGRVIDDRNGNGTLDAGETGLAGVQVTDGVQFVQSGPDGSYELKMVEDPVVPFHPSRTVYVCWPSGHWP